MGFCSFGIMFMQVYRIADDLPQIDKWQIRKNLNHFQYERNILEKLFDDLTSLDSSSNELHNTRSVRRNLPQYMGSEKFNISWLIPTRART